MPRMLFEKTGSSIWISHLDLMRVFQRAFRRAGLLLKHSQGFTPRAIVSLALPLSVGVESKCEFLDFELEDGTVPALEQINAVLPEGIRGLKIYEDGRKLKELTHLQAKLCLTYDNGVPTDAVSQLNALYHREELILKKHSRKGETETNILPMIKELQISQTDENQMEMSVIVCAQNPSLNPMMLVTAIETYLPDYAPDGVSCVREEVLDAQGVVFR